MKFLIVTMIIIIMTIPNSYGDIIKEINWATQEWKGYTDKDGSGIYSQVVRRVFAESNIKTTISYMPFERSIRLLKKCQSGFCWCFTA